MTELDLPGLQRTERWALALGSQPLEWDVLTDLRVAVTQAITRGDPLRLRALNRRLAPLAARLNRRLDREEIPDWVLQAAEIPPMAAKVRIALRMVDRGDPTQHLQRIRHGEAVLRALCTLACLEGAKRQDYFPVRLEAIRRELADSGPGPSGSTVSRALRSLDEAGLIHLIGATRSRRCALLPAAWDRLDRDTSNPKLRLVSQEPESPEPESPELELLEPAPAVKEVGEVSAKDFLRVVG